MTESKPTLSLCMIIKNEQEFLEQCLNSVKELVDEIIIVDTGSTDNTINIAKKFTDNIHSFQWCDDFSKARNESLKHATKDWILILDADETIDKSDLAKIKQALDSDDKAFRLNVVNITKTGNEIFKLVRLFKNNEEFYFKNRIHELIDDSISEKSIKIRDLDAKILHHGLLQKDEAAIKNKISTYISLILKQLKEDPKNPRYTYQAGRAYLQLNDLDSALKYFKQTASLNPNYKLIYSDIAKVYLKKNMIKEAIESYKKSAELNPNNPSPPNNLAVLYGIAGQMDKAKQLIEELIKKFPDNEAIKTNYNRIINS